MGIFDGIASSIFGGLTSLAGGLFAQDKTDQRQQQAQQFNASQAQADRDFQERMSSTAYQRSMQDMEAAGLNPILAYQKGGASSPSGAMASTTFQPAQNIGAEAVNGAKAAGELGNLLDRMNLDREKTQQEIDNIAKDTRKKVAEGNAADETSHLRAAEAANEREQLPVHTARKLQAEADKDVYSSDAGKLARKVGTYGTEVQRASSAVGNLPALIGSANKAVSDRFGTWSQRRDRGE